MKDKVEKLIRDYVGTYAQKNSTNTRWKEPLTAFADAEDPIFREFKRIISPSHALPTDFLEDAKTVVTYFLPFEDFVVESNRTGRESSRTWGIAYVETNRLILDLNNYLRDEFEKMGYRGAVIPATHNFDEDKLISDWSHRHTAYAAGLGKFGLNNMLITEKGCCGRVGSFVTNLKIEASKREDGEYCLYKKYGSCKKCAGKCVNEALGVDSFDRFKCYEMCLLNASLMEDIGLADVCGKCLVDIPCSHMNPSKNMR